MNEAETRAEHVDPALKAAGWGVIEGSRILREYPITLGRIEGHGAAWHTADGRLRARLPQSQACRHRSQVPIASPGNANLPIGAPKDGVTAFKNLEAQRSAR